MEYLSAQRIFTSGTAEYMGYLLGNGNVENVVSLRPRLCAWNPEWRPRPVCRFFWVIRDGLSFRSGERSSAGQRAVHLQT